MRTTIPHTPVIDLTVPVSTDSRNLLPIEPPTKPGLYAYTTNDQGSARIELCVVIDNDGKTIYGQIKRQPDGGHFSSEPPPGQFYDYVQ